MNGYTTMTQKGQIVIPANIRQYLGLKPSARFYVEVKDKGIIAKPVMTIDQAFGMIKSTGRPLTKRTMKKIIRKAVAEKYAKKLRQENSF